MKKIILFIIIGLFCESAQGQNTTQVPIQGSWINASLFSYYYSYKDIDSSCSIFHLNHRSLVPLFLSFTGKNKLELTERYEQGKTIYKVTQITPDLILISRGRIRREIYVTKELLKLRYHDNLVIFKKVSNYYSNDVFGEFIKSVIFKKYKTYTLAFFKDSNSYGNKVFNRSNFQKLLKKIFKCDAVDIAQLGSFKHKESCLPEIAIYFYNKGKGWIPPRVLGILTDNEDIKFIDVSGVTILTLKPRCL